MWPWADRAAGAAAVIQARGIWAAGLSCRACRPETSAEAARGYPTFVTIWPLIVAIVLGALLASTGQMYRQMESFPASLPATYDQYYPRGIKTAEGVLSAKGRDF